MPTASRRDLRALLDSSRSRTSLLRSKMTSVLLGNTHGISVVDFKPFLDGSAKQDVAQAMLDSFKRVGFVYLVNHGIPADKTREMFDWVRF